MRTIKRFFRIAAMFFRMDGRSQEMAEHHVERVFSHRWII